MAISFLQEEVFHLLTAMVQPRLDRAPRDVQDLCDLFERQIVQVKENEGRPLAKWDSPKAFMHQVSVFGMTHRVFIGIVGWLDDVAEGSLPLVEPALLSQIRDGPVVSAAARRRTTGAAPVGVDRRELMAASGSRCGGIVAAGWGGN